MSVLLPKIFEADSQAVEQSGETVSASGSTTRCATEPAQKDSVVVDTPPPKSNRPTNVKNCEQRVRKVKQAEDERDQQ